MTQSHPRRMENNFDYKLHIMELAMEWAEENSQLELDRASCNFRTTRDDIL
ncbi:hypothetical protein B0O80DRAFT_501975 [Mortierella sp. GBAus27b]|nr:hypothetical protein B0O80DRAFT_501975 [Mortierella sp. GBAus27b]